MGERLEGRSVQLVINETIVRLDLTNGRMRPKLALLGPRGTYTEEAVDLSLGSERSVRIDEDLLRSNGEVIRKVDSGDYDLGVVAVENSTEGNVMETLRELVHARNSVVLGEIVIPIRHALIGKPGDQITRIYSHPQALGQCSRFLSTYYPDADLIEKASTSQAIETIKGLENAAAIGSQTAAKRFGVPVIRENIGDNVNNATRFLIVGSGETEATGEDTTLMVFIPKEERPGILKDCLEVLAVHGVNLTKIDSHPTGSLKQYMFLVSLDGHIRDENVRQAVELLGSRYCNSLKILGSYKRSQLPEGVREPGVININNNSN